MGGNDAALQLQIDNLTTQLSQCRTEKTNIQAQLNTCLGSQAGDTSVIASLQVENQALEIQITQKTAQITSLTTQLATCNASLANCSGSQTVPVPPRVDCGIIDPNPIYTLIQNRWGMTMFNEGKVLASSGQYKITTIDSLMEFVRFTKVNQYPYVPTFHDCPDFAYALLGKFCNTPQWWGTALGVVTIMSDAGWHRLNIAFTYPSSTNHTLTMNLIEPQTASIIDAAFVGREACLVLLP
jgi:hypothetical protein